MDDSQPRVCADCGIPAPATESAYTLISSRHGWRLQYEVDARGEKQPKWRCGMIAGAATKASHAK